MYTLFLSLCFIATFFSTPIICAETDFVSFDSEFQYNEYDSPSGQQSIEFSTESNDHFSDIDDDDSFDLEINDDAPMSDLTEDSAILDFKETDDMFDYDSDDMLDSDSDDMLEDMSLSELEGQLEEPYNENIIINVGSSEENNASAMGLQIGGGIVGGGGLSTIGSSIYQTVQEKTKDKSAGEILKMGFKTGDQLAGQYAYSRVTGQEFDPMNRQNQPSFSDGGSTAFRQFQNKDNRNQMFQAADVMAGQAATEYVSGYTQGYQQNMMGMGYEDDIGARRYDQQDDFDMPRKRYQSSAPSTPPPAYRTPPDYGRSSGGGQARTPRPSSSSSQRSRPGRSQRSSRSHLINRVSTPRSGRRSSRRRG